ncbi:maltokinase N-terminal cap-like domain-containing protein [Streptomyces griseorubiginosus]|uniref:maltokinase N-terminal cap-like domain-containing protein n=1 Tax=Streptomyces griseorubiginosus TaxID=67304 RepID=UPI0036E1D799
MAIIHHTTLKPTKLELLTTWLPTRPWYTGSGTPELTKAGGFRLDDPEGEVGIEFMVAVDTSGPEPVAYHVPLTYRAAPLPGADHALVGTMEHGVLGPRWAYDGVHDPVLRTELLALFEGRAEAMAQSISDTPDHEVAHTYAGPALPTGSAEITDDRDGTGLTLADGTVLHIHRTLSPTPPDGTSGQISTTWEASNGTRLRTVFASLRTP